MDQTYTQRVMTAADRDLMIDWAAAEGWNPGAQDAECFAQADPRGFWGGWLDGQMVAAISVVNYDPGFAFLGFYIVAPVWRGRGFGLQLWQRALDHAGRRVVGLDGVVDQQDNYRASGFELAYRNIRYGGVPAVLPVAVVAGLDLHYIDTPDAQLEALDRSVFPAARRSFWQGWMQATAHVTVQAVQAGDTVGFGTIRPCREGYKIGPLVAHSQQVAEAILARLLQGIGPQDQVFLDVPEPNIAGNNVAQSLGLRPVFETARMFRGPAPNIDVNKVFGVTSFELG